MRKIQLNKILTIYNKIKCINSWKKGVELLSILLF